MTQHISTLVATHGLLAVFILMTLESTCIPIPSEAVMPYAGFLVYNHTLSSSFWTVVLVGTLANVVGGLIAYWIGRTGGRAFVLRWGRYVLLNRHHLERAEAWFAKRGEITVLLARLLPALRTFISLPAGVAKMPIGQFILYSAIGSLPWNWALTYAGFQLGKNWETIGHYLKPISYVGALLLLAAVVWFWFGRRRETTDKTQGKM